MIRSTRETALLLTVAFLGTLASHSVAFADDPPPIKITSPADGSTVHVGPMSSPLEVKVTVDIDNYDAFSASINYDVGGSTVLISTTVRVEDPAFALGTGHFIFKIEGIGSGTYTNCVVPAAAKKMTYPDRDKIVPADPVSVTVEKD